MNDAISEFRMVLKHNYHIVQSRTKGVQGTRAKFSNQWRQDQVSVELLNGFTELIILYKYMGLKDSLNNYINDIWVLKKGKLVWMKLLERGTHGRKKVIFQQNFNNFFSFTY